MKAFLFKVLIFISPVILWAILEAFILPPNFFTFRSWEALTFTKGFPADGPFYPNMSISMHEKGDMSPHLHKPSPQLTHWHTDSLGYRNNKLVRKPDILLIGDSFIAGSRLDQSQTLANVLDTMLAPKANIYSLAPSTFDRYNELYKAGILAKPKMIIYANVERTVPLPFDSLKPLSPGRPWVQLFKKSGMSAVLDRLLRMYAIETVKATIKGRKGHMRSPLDNQMYFLHGAEVPVDGRSHLAQTSAALRTYKKYCDSQHIEFLFIPMPNKETVYYDLVPFESQPNYLLQLDSMLHSQQVPCINTVQMYNEERKKNTILLYHPDDTHWNVNAVRLVAQEIAKRVPASLKKK